MTVVSESFGRMPELERQEMVAQQNVPLPSAEGADGGEEDENAFPPQLDAEETMDRPILNLPKRLLEMALAAITTHSKNEKATDESAALSPRPSPSLPSVCFSCSSSSSTSTDEAQNNGERTGRKRIGADNGRTYGGGAEGGGPLRKRRRIGPRIGPRRKQRGQRHRGQEAGRHYDETLKQKQDICIDTSPIRMALITVPEEAKTVLEHQKAVATRKRRGQPSAIMQPKRSVASLLPLVSNWRPIGPGCVRRPFPECRHTFICYDAIRHRNVPNIVIRIGDCVQVNSADSEDDLFVGRVLAINYEPESRALQLTLLWFYTPRQLPSTPPISEFDACELFASKHLDSVNVDSVDAVVHVLTFAEYCRYRAEVALTRLQNGRFVRSVPSPFRPPCPLSVSDYPRRDFLPPLGTPSDAVFFCRGVFSLTKKRTVSFGCAKPTKALRGLRPKITGSSE